MRFRGASKGRIVAGIVVGIDGSDHSLSALRWAADEARLRGVPLRPVATFSIGFLSTGYEVALPDVEDLRAATRTMLDAAIDSVEHEGVEVDPRVVEGHPGEVLISMGEEADMIVVGSRGRGGFVGVLLGSVTTNVVNHATCPVVVVR